MYIIIVIALLINHFPIKDMELKPIMIVLITTSQFNNSIQMNYNLDIISYQNAVIVGRKELDIGRDKRNASIMVEYDSGLQVYSNDSKLLSKDCVRD